MSRVDNITFRGKSYFIKRDDLIDKFYSGNKARKFFYFFDKDLSSYKKIVSFGGNQSNAMLSLAKLAFDKKIAFDYYIKPMPEYLKNNIEGNLKYSLDFGMNLVEAEKFPTKESFSDEILFIKQGGADSYSEYGFEQLAKELKEYIKEQNLKDVAIFLPSGTGVSSLYLQKHLDIKVYTTPCVGDSEYLKKQFLNLESKNLPTILNIDKKYHFGKLYREFYDIYLELLHESKIEFDLLYDPKGWIVLDRFKDEIEQNIIYIHCGGLIGNETMLKRYRNKYKLKN